MELNDNVTVKLTEAGAKILNDQNIKLKQLFPKLYWKTNYKAEEFYSVQLWNLFNDFGKHCCCGGEVVFTNLELYTK